MTSAPPKPALTGEQVEAIHALYVQATEGPWAWDQRGEKINEWGLGVAFDAASAPIAGRFTDEDAQYVEYVCSHEGATVNYADPELICTLRNAWPALRDAALRAAALEQQLEAISKGDYIVVSAERHKELVAAMEQLEAARKDNKRFRNGFANLYQALQDAPGLPIEALDEEDQAKWTDLITGVLMALGCLEVDGRPMPLWESLQEAVDAARKASS